MENLRCEKAVEKKHNGYNCAQAVACSFCKEASMDEDTLKKINTGIRCRSWHYGRYMRSNLRCCSCSWTY